MAKTARCCVTVSGSRRTEVGVHHCDSHRAATAAERERDHEVKMEQLRIEEEDRVLKTPFFFCKYQLNIHLFNLNHSLFICHMSSISAMKRNKRSIYKWSIAALHTKHTKLFI
jgi:hypothetical protein